MAPQCTRPKTSGEGSPAKAKLQKAEDEVSQGGDKDAKGKDEVQDGSEEGSMKGLLEQANKMLKSLTSSGTTTSSSSSESRDEVLNRLQEQINSLKLKTLRISQVSVGEQQGLIDSGAAHALRPKHQGESFEKFQKISVTLANGQTTVLQLSPGGVLVSDQLDIEPIVPMGSLTSQLGCSVKWEGENLEVIHPSKGKLKTWCAGGCPQISKNLAMQLIDEIETKASALKAEEGHFHQEVKWMKDLVSSHPVLRSLPEEIQRKLVVNPGSWSDFPLNKRLRKKIQRQGMTVHLYAGEEEGFTLRRAYQQIGGDPELLIEIDLKRGESHNMVTDTGMYAALIRAILEDKVLAIVGGPNCRSRSVLRHYPIPGQPDAPRPLRQWGDFEFGIPDANDQEKMILFEDDLMLWRMVFLFMVGTYYRRARQISTPIGFLVEQPASPHEYVPEVVSLWRTDQWAKIKEEFNFHETTFQQGQLGGQVPKPTTFGGNLQLEVRKHKMRKRSSQGEVKSSKDLARWSPGTMNMVAEALVTQVHRQEPKLRPLSWEEHLRYGHTPYRRDCAVRQQAMQQQAPHRKVPNPRGGVLSVDTAGPLQKASDLGGLKARYLLVAVLTWKVPKGSQKFHEPEVGEVEAEAPVLEEVKDKEAADPLPLEDQEADQQEAADPQNPEVVAEEGPIEPVQVPPQDGPIDVPEAGLAPGGVVAEVPEPGPAPGGAIAEELAEAQQEMETRSFRLVAPLVSKTSKETTRETMNMILRLRADGYHVGSIHADQGHEFYGSFRTWCFERGIHVTRTSGDDPKGNGRCEAAVKSLKTQIRRVLFGAGVSTSWWPWAARWVNEANRMTRLDKLIDFPPFLQEVVVKKRKWRQGVFESATEKVRYLCPAPDLHGHWIVQGDDTPRVTKFLLKSTTLPISDEAWMALEAEVPDPHERRRRLRDKVTVRKVQVESQGEEEKEREREVEFASRVKQILEEEMPLLMFEGSDLAEEEMKILTALRKQATTDQRQEEEEVLQTKIVSPKEVSAQWDQWEEATKAEINALLFEKEAFKELSKEELASLAEKAEREGRKIEVIPSKIVATRKPGPSGGKKKIRWVVCGNLEPVKQDEETFSSGADAAAFRILIWVSCLNQWEAQILDVKTAFLNAVMEISDTEDYLVVRPPPLLIEKKIYPPEARFLPLKAVYGFRRSPRLWGKCRDRTLESLKILVDFHGFQLTLKLVPLDSEPNVWRLVNADQPEDQKLYGLLMTYVDDLFATAPQRILDSLVKKLQTTWSTSTPEKVGSKPTRFLGMEITKVPSSETRRDEWYLTQTSYTRDLIAKSEFSVKPRKIPIARDQSVMDPEDGPITTEAIREGQKYVGEALWLATRSRPDLAYCVSRMGSNTTTAPSAVKETFQQMLGYLQSTENEGLKYQTLEGESPKVVAYSDASFAPGGTASYGAFVIMLGSTAVFWRAGKQSTVSLSTAEAELSEIIEAMLAGESISVIVSELYPDTVKHMISDSTSAISILSSEGGNWRTRHLRLRAAFARQAVFQGEWLLQHIPGEVMIADLGTKPLAGPRLEVLKKLLGMSPAPEREEEAEEQKQKKIEVEERIRGVRISEAAQVVQLLTLAAQIQAARSMEEEEIEDESYPIEALFFYTILVVMITLFAARLWKVAVQLWSALMRWLTALRAGSRPEVEAGGEGQKKEEKKEESEEESFEESVSEPDDTPASVPQPVVEEEPTEDPMTLDIMAELEAIEIEERQIWRDLNSAQPGDPMLGPDVAPRPLPFHIFTTRFGRVYHLSRSCRYLTAPQTGAARESEWCGVCQNVACQTRGLPPPGITIYLRGWGEDAHTDPRCPAARNAEHYTLCTACAPSEAAWAVRDEFFQLCHATFRMREGGVQMDHFFHVT